MNLNHLLGTQFSHPSGLSGPEQLLIKEMLEVDACVVVVEGTEDDTVVVPLVSVKVEVVME